MATPIEMSDEEVMLAFLEAEVKASAPPTMQEVATAAGFKSKSAMWRRLQMLELRGWLRRRTEDTAPRNLIATRKGRTGARNF